MSPAILYLEECLAQRRATPGAIAECLYWAGVLAALRDRLTPRQLASPRDATDALGAALLALHEADRYPHDRRDAAVLLRALADHLDAGGEPPYVWDAVGHFERELSE